MSLMEKKKEIIKVHRFFNRCDYPDRLSGARS
jgi:hypothetical protein